MRFTATLISVACLATARAQPPAAAGGDPLEELVRASPFIPAGGVVRGEGASGEFELRGVVWDGATLRFSIFDRGTGESVWTRLDEEGLPFRARSFDREKELLTLEYQGRVLALPLVEPRLAETEPAEPPAGSPPLPTNNPGGGIGGPPQPGGAPPPANPPGTSAHDAQQLQQMADEARRRRGVGPPPTPPRN